MSSIPKIKARKGEVMLAKEYTGKEDVKNYWVSEKYDGMRAIWTGKELLSRAGNPIQAPKWFINKLPKIPLDGELFLARGKFQQAMSIIKRSVPEDADWKKIKYMIFNSPTEGTFENRQNVLKTQVPKDNQLIVVNQRRVSTKKQLTNMLNAVLKKEGEGLVIRKNKSLYEPKRSATFMKVKRSQNAEAIVTDIVEGKGKHVGKLGAIWVKSKNNPNIQFKLGTGFNNDMREKLWSKNTIGKTVTYKYKSKTNAGKPRFASFLRMFNS